MEVKRVKSSYIPKGVCSSLIEYEVDDNNILKELKITHGCNGNLKAISKLCSGRNIDDIINDLEGINVALKKHLVQIK